MSNALGPWGVSSRAEGLYRQLLRRPETRFEDLVDTHGFTVDECQSCLEELGRAELITVGSDGTISVTPPLRALEALVTREREQLHDRMNELDTAGVALTRYIREYRPMTVEAPLAEIVPYAQWFDVLSGLIDGTDAPVVTVYLTMRPDLVERLEMIRFALSRGRDYRLLFPIEYLNDSEFVQPMRAMLREGVEVRFAARTVTSLSIFGNTAASILVDPSEYYSERLVIRMPTLLSILHEYFDGLWRIAVPLVQERDGDDHEILLLLAQGLKDESIASQLGLSLRTVRRRIADLHDQPGADSRFQAGVEAARRGWI
jgi:DNA-binding CsgD family transcriptional regulator/DNA-binding transcriptional MerR regulator